MDHWNRGGPGHTRAGTGQLRNALRFEKDARSLAARRSLHVMVMVSSLPPTPSPISVAARAAHAFTSHALVQGLASHSRGVDVVLVADDRFAARVRSKRAHDISLRARSGGLFIACTCPAQSLGLKGCKHAWAALLEADRQGALPALRRDHAPLHVEMVPLDSERTAAASEAKAATKKPGIAKAASTKSKRAASERAKRTSAGRSREQAAPPSPPAKTKRRRARAEQ